jgi:hypothetical protein
MPDDATRVAADDATTEVEETDVGFEAETQPVTLVGAAGPNSKAASLQ